MDSEFQHLQLPSCGIWISLGLHADLPGGGQYSTKGLKAEKTVAMI